MYLYVELLFDCGIFNVVLHFRDDCATLNIIGTFGVGEMRNFKFYHDIQSELYLHNKI